MSPRTLSHSLGTVLVALALAVGTVSCSGSTDQPTPPAVNTPASPQVADQRPNVILVMLDDMRIDEMRFAPNAEKYITDRGLDFENSFSPYPLCCPARASFLLGQYAHNHKVLYHDAPYGFGAIDDSVTVATAMQDAGYQTAMVGKYLNRYGIQKSRVTGESSIRYEPAGWTDWMAGLDTTWPITSPNFGGTYNYFAFTQNINGKVVPHRGQYSSDLIGKQVRGLIKKYHRSTKPFFMWVTPVAPHIGGPKEPGDPEDFMEASGRVQEFGTPARPNAVKGMFNDLISHSPGVPSKHGAEADMSDKPANLQGISEVVPVEAQRLRDVARQRAESIYAWDVQFGKIIEQLKASGEYANTILMFTSDNGYYLGEHRRRLGKVQAHEPALRVPFVVAGPGVKRGTRYAPITTFDLTSTILDIAGAKQLRAMDGESRLPQMTGADSNWVYPIVTEGLLAGFVPKIEGFQPGLTTIGIRTGQWKYLRYRNGDVELYNLSVDPNELTGLRGDPAYAEVEAGLKAMWEKYKDCVAAACRAPMPVRFQTTPTYSADVVSNALTQRARYYD